MSKKNKKASKTDIKNQAGKGLLDTNFGFKGGDFLVGALIGAAAAYILTNEKASKAVLKTLAKGTNIFQAGFEELKERFEDIRAELEAQSSAQ